MLASVCDNIQTQTSTHTHMKGEHEITSRSCTHNGRMKYSEIWPAAVCALCVVCFHCAARDVYTGNKNSIINAISACAEQRENSLEIRTHAADN